jgi:hypothetical protein
MYTTDYLITQTNTRSFDRGLAQFNSALTRGWLKRIGGGLIGRKRDLHHLPQTVKTPQRLAGVQLIAARDIVGSEDRSGDFDRDFNPLRESLRDRWLSVFSARQRGVALPPIELVRGPDGYYVRDGHHRLSVARALGQDDVEAIVLA